jgi:hypothetical protein
MLCGWDWYQPSNRRSGFSKPIDRAVRTPTVVSRSNCGTIQDCSRDRSHIVCFMATIADLRVEICIDLEMGRSEEVFE